ncbi:nitrate- and nitrite sensing domain-containing protein [Acrocarpospora sp. B8E8]|uniref:sensor histidine kinase n=1 Tax=Acrocarpospora sp. B8E8 TaxID=3153572 RepID=UPI00325DDEA8
MRTATIDNDHRTVSETPPAALPGPEDEEDTRNRLALKNWRVRSRLVALILVPTIAAVLLGGLRVVTSINSAAEYQRVSEVAVFTGILSDLIHELQLERDLTARYIETGRSGEPALGLVRNQRGSVDVLTDAVRSRVEVTGDSFGEVGRQNLSRLDRRLGELANLRKTTVETQLPALLAIDKYSAFIADLIRLYDENGQGGVDEELDASATALASLARAKNEASIVRATLALGTTVGRFDPLELDAFTAARKRQEGELNAFRTVATPGERQSYADLVTGPEIDRAEFLRLSALEVIRTRRLLNNLDDRPGPDGDEWFQVSSATVDKMHEVEKLQIASIVDRSNGFAAADQRGAIANIIVVVLILGLVLVITTAMARSLVRPLRRLRSEALEIAGHKLPELVQRLRDSDGTGNTPEVKPQPIGVSSTDEIGEVARAFDEVHQEAVRLAGDEAKLRSNVSAMFVNLSRRTQTLVERQIALIDGLEQGEQDEQRLGNLFKLDHLATRMRRNSENLLVLAGQEPARRWSQPVELTDVIRAALSEVEGYERVAINIPSDVALAGQAVNDVIHLLAELVENALSFSARDTRVVVSGNRIDGGGVMVSVTDGGIGMTQEEIAATNWRLANPPVVDVSVSRRMGLFVVGRLALRNGIRVQLRSHDSGGLTAMVLLPESLMGAPAYSQQQYAGTFAPSWSPQGQSEPVAWGAPPLALSAPAPNGPGGPFATPGPGGQHPSFPPPGMPQAMFGVDNGGPQRSAFDGRGPADGRNALGGGPAGALPPSPFDGRGAFGSPQGQPNPFDQQPARSPFDAPATGQVMRSPFDPRTPPGAPGPASNGPPLPKRRGDSGLSGISGFSGMPGMSGMDVDSTGPLPAVREERPEDFLPIFAAVESAWFQRSPEDKSWNQTPADNGWEAAAQQPSWEASTSSGLPKRVPKANLVPGSADAGKPAIAPMPALSPERARSRLSSLQQGVRQGRAVARGEISEDEGYPGAGRGEKP